MAAERYRKDRGAVIVEFALILPILVLLLVGITEFGRLYNYQVSIQAAAREGARQLALGNDGLVVSTVINAAPSAQLAPGDVQILQSCPEGDTTSSARVRVSKDFTFIGFLDLGSITLDAEAGMRCGL